VNGGTHLSKVLVVDQSAVLRDLLRLSLNEHADRVLTASSVREAETRIGEHCDIDLVVSDTSLPDGDGFRLLSCVNALEAPKPRVILTSGDPSDEDTDRAFQMGAIGYLAKPLAVRDIAAILAQHRSDWSNRRRPRRRSEGRACVLDRAPAHVSRQARPLQLFWFMRDVGETGAFLETESAIPIGTLFELELELGQARAVVSAKVVRVQEPAWGNPAGIGIHFTEFGTDAQSQLTRYVEGEAC
jgi:CheY-like chemotaxis protein